MGRVIVASVTLCVCLCVRTLKRKQLKLTIPNFILADIQCMAVSRRALPLGSKGQGHTVIRYAVDNLTWVCMSIGLLRFTSFFNAVITDVLFFS